MPTLYVIAGPNGIGKTTALTTLSLYTPLIHSDGIDSSDAYKFVVLFSIRDSQIEN